MNLRRVFIGFLAFSLIAGTAYAAGNTVSVLVNGNPVKSGTIIDGSTMLPLRAIGEALGANVEWDNVRKQAKVTMPQQASQSATEGLSLAELNKIGESVGVVYAYNGQTYLGQGSGFVVDDSVFVTNFHVVEGATRLQIMFGKESVEVQTSSALFSNKEHDLFGIRVTGFPSLRLSTVDPKKGDKVYALGYPENKFQLSEGIIEAMPSYEYTALVTNAEVSPGSSGGLMVGSSGEVIGVVKGGYGETSNAIHVKHLQAELVD